MDREDISYTEQDERVLKIVYNGDNLETIPVYVFFDKDGDPYVQFKCWNIANFKTNREKGIDVCNQLNHEYRWVRFYIDNDNDVVADIDAVIDEDTCGDVCFSLVGRVVSIVDEAYPTIAKARWA